MKVSVIIPTYKRPHMLDRAIKSVLNQTYDDIEIIIVDDNEPNTIYRKKTEKFMEKYCNNKAIKYIKRENNGGGAVARNTGINKCKGELISFLDDDDEFLPGKIECQVKNIIEKNTDVSVCASQTFDQNGKIQEIKMYDEFDYYEDKMIYHIWKMIVGTQTFLIKKSILRKINGFSDVPAGQEFVLMYRMLEIGAKISVVNKVLTNIYIHSEERITVGPKKIIAEKMLYKMKKKYFYKLNKKQKKDVKYRFYSILFGTYWKLNKKLISLLYLFICFVIKPIYTFKVFIDRCSNIFNRNGD